MPEEKTGLMQVTNTQRHHKNNKQNVGLDPAAADKISKESTNGTKKTLYRNNSRKSSN